MFLPDPHTLLVPRRLDSYSHRPGIKLLFGFKHLIIIETFLLLQKRHRQKWKYVLLEIVSYFLWLSFLAQRKIISYLIAPHAFASNFTLLDFERFNVIFDLFLIRLTERLIGWIIPEKVRIKCTCIFGKYFWESFFLAQQRKIPKGKELILEAGWEGLISV